MSVRRLIVEVDLEGLNVAEFCRQHGVSTWLFYQLRRRYQTEGETGLESRSRAPKRVANRTPAWIEDVIVAERKRLEEEGWDAGAATIAFRLPDLLPAEIAPPSEATIWRVLTRRGFVVPQPKKAPQHSYRSFSAERVNECWQLDDTDWELADGTSVRILNIIDDCSRVAVASQALATCTTAGTVETFLTAANSWGLPARFLSDNAQAFRYGLAEAVTALGIEAGHSRPYHPQTCGKVERFHQTLKKWLAQQPPPASLAELQAQLDRFRHLYNHQRPHRSLDRRLPIQVFAQTPKAAPKNRPLGQPTTTHRVRVFGGTVSIGQRYQISVGAEYNGQTTTVIITGTACHIFIAGKLIRQHTLDPQRRVQPLYHRRGHPGSLKPQP
jgi:transposase InsO family protein